MDSSLKNEIFRYADKPWNALEDPEISELVWDVLDLIHDYDWYRSGDTCEETYLESKRAFKKKWFESVRKDTIRRIVQQELNKTREELFKAFDLRNSNMNRSFKF